MAKFISDYHVYIFALVKILIMLGFFLNMAPMLVFGERRQAALIQDRPGPNRALIVVPGLLLKALLSAPAIGAAAGVLGLFFVLFPPTAEGAVTRGFWLGHLGLFAVWFNAYVLLATLRLRNIAPGNVIENELMTMKDPRQIFWGSLVLHAMWIGLFAIAPAESKGPGAILAYGGPGVLALGLLAVGLYAGARIPNEPIPLRFAGLFHSIADALKGIFKEDFIPERADKLLHALGPLIALFPALVTYAVIPFGDTLCIGSSTTADGHKIMDLTKIAETLPRGGQCTDYAVSFQIADLNVGILYLFAVAGTGIVGAAIAGWSSDNKWSLLGGLRAASQMVSYEVSIGLSLVGAFMIYGTPRLNEMVRWQVENTWGIFVQPVAFFLFFAAVIAEHKRTPFDAPEGESEIVAGFFVEYSSMKWLMFYTGEYMEVVTSSALLVTIFLGGWSVPFLHSNGLSVELGSTVLYATSLSHITVTLLQIAAFFGKVILLSFGQLFIRWTVPRFRYDQIMAFGWKFLLPTALTNVLVTGILMLVYQSAGAAVQSGLKLVADVTMFAVVGAVVFVAVRFFGVLLEPVERNRFFNSSSAERTARMGGVKTEPIQA